MNAFIPCYLPLCARVDLDSVAAEWTTLQPQLMIVGHSKGSQAVIIEGKQVLLGVDGCSIIEGLIHVTLRASYYVFM